MAYLPEGIDLAQLLRFPLFAGLDKGQLTQLVQNSDVKSYSKKDGMIVREGEESNGLAIILKGKVKVFKTDPKGEKHLLGALSEGEFFGEMGLPHGDPRSASVQATTDTSILWLGRSRFFDLMSSHGEVMSRILFRMVIDLGTRLRQLDERYVAVKGYMESI